MTCSIEGESLRTINCADCGTEVTATGTRQRYCKGCKSKRNVARAKRYQEQHPEKARAYARKGAAKQRAKSPEKVRAATKAWREKNKEHIAVYAETYNAANRERIGANQRAWIDRNRERYAKWQSDYARMRNAKLRGSMTAGPVRLADIADRDDWRCHLCGDGVSRADWSLDHLIPVSKGGPHIPDNVALAHRICNVRRNNRDLDSWRSILAARAA